MISFLEALALLQTIYNSQVRIILAIYCLYNTY